jgi:cbb3-type cytochrome oxidase subunit 3
MSNKVKFFILFLFLVVVASVVAMFARSRKRKAQVLQPIQQR